MTTYGAPAPYVPISERVGLHYTECVTCTGAVLGNIASHNAHPATYGEALSLRKATGVTSPPLGPADLERAFKARYGWNVPTFAGTSIDLINAIRTGNWAAVYIIYGRWPEVLKIQKDFNDGHCILAGRFDPHGNARAGYVWIVDPLFYPGSGYSGAWASEAQLIAALYQHWAGSTLTPLATVLAPGQFAPTTTNPASPKVRVVFGTFVTYTVREGTDHRYRIYGHSRRFARPNTMIPVTATETPIVNAAPMRQITAGPYANLWVIAHGGLAYSE